MSSLLIFQNFRCMLDYLLRNKLISKHQHGFLARRSTCSQLLECCNDWSLSLTARNFVDCAMLILVKHSIPLFIQNFVVSYPPMVFKVNC